MATEKLEIVISAVDKATGPVKGITKTFRGFSKFALKGLAIGAGAAATGLVALGGAAAKLAIDAAPLQQVQSAFDGVAKSAGIGGDAMLEALQKGSGGMITNRDLMISFNKAASLVSKDFAKQLPDAMGMLSKVAASTGQDLDFLLDSLVTGVGRVSPMILDNLGIQVSLAEATERAAEMFGVEAAELDKTQQQAGVMNVVMEKLKESTADIPEITGSAMQGWAAFQTTLANTKDEIGLALLPVFTPLFNALGSLASEWLPKAVDAIRPFLDRLGLAAELFSKFGFNAGTIRFALEQVFGKETIDKVFNMIESFTEFKDNIQQAVQPVFERVSSWLRDNLPKAITIAKNFLENRLKPAIQSVSDWVTGTLIPAFFQFKSWIQNNIPVVQEFIQNFFAKIKEWWDANGAFVIAALLTGWEVIKGAVTAAISIIRPAIEEFFKSIRERFDAFGPLVESFKELWESLKPIVGAVLAAIGALVLLAIGIISGAFRGLAKAIGPLIDTFIDVVGGIVTFLTGVANYVTGFVELIIALFQGNTEGVEAALEKMREAVDTIWQGIVDTVTGLVSGLVETVIAFISGLITGIIDFFNNLYNELVGGSIIPDLVNSIVQWFTDLKDDALQLWEDLKEGIVEFIEAIIENIEESLSTALENLRTAFETIMTGISEAIQPVKDLWDDFVSAIQNFWDWLSGKVFNFSINLPELPDWAIPGSPLPIHAAWLDFARDMEGLIKPGVGATTSSISNAIENNFNLTINEAGRTVDPLYGFEMMKALARGV